MVKKLQKMSAKKKTSSAFADALPAGLLDSALAQNVKDSAQQIWAAGLGAFAKAQGEGGKVFDALVKEGLNLQKKTQSAAEEKLSAMASKVSGMAGDVGSKAGQQWDKLESIFEERVAKAMKSLGVPSAKDVAELTQRIDALSAAMGIKPVAAKSAKKAPAAKPVAKPAVKAVKTAAKKAVVAAKPAVKPAKTAAKKVVAKAEATAAAPAAKAPAKKRAPAKKAADAASAPAAAAAQA
jgi:poly(hydroxyalkanoate) granule-associated protein